MACSLNKEAIALSKELDKGMSKDWRPDADRGPGKRKITLHKPFGSASDD